MAIASLILGILSIFLVVIPPFGFLFGILGVVFGVLARKEVPPSGIATGGLVTSITGLSISLVFAITCFACWTGGKRLLYDAMKNQNLQMPRDPFLRDPKKAEEELRTTIKQLMAPQQDKANQVQPQQGK